MPKIYIILRLKIILNWSKSRSDLIPPPNCGSIWNEKLFKILTSKRGQEIPHYASLHSEWQATFYNRGREAGAFRRNSHNSVKSCPKRPCFPPQSLETTLSSRTKWGISSNNKTTDCEALSSLIPIPGMRDLINQKTNWSKISPLITEWGISFYKPIGYELLFFVMEWEI